MTSRVQEQEERERRDLPDVIVFDRMPVAVRRLIGNSCLAGAVQLSDRESMLGGGIVTECHPIIPPMALSSGEQHLWRFLASLAGQGQVSLYEVANHFRSSGYIMLIIEAFESIAGVIPRPEDGR